MLTVTSRKTDLKLVLIITPETGVNRLLPGWAGIYVGLAGCGMRDKGKIKAGRGSFKR